jgi:hypothetical protein
VQLLSATALAGKSSPRDDLLPSPFYGMLLMRTDSMWIEIEILQK